MYQLILQFPASVVDFDDLIEIEDQLARALGESGRVDGHDFGSGEANIFLFTADPPQTLAVVLPVLRDLSRESDATAAYRTVGGNQYTVIWPRGFRGEFSVA